MKRLLAYLFIVLGLGLTFSVKSNAINPLLALEGLNLGVNILKGGVDKIKDATNKRKKKSNQAKTDYICFKSFNSYELTVKSFNYHNFNYDICINNISNDKLYQRLAYIKNKNYVEKKTINRIFKEQSYNYEFSTKKIVQKNSSDQNYKKKITNELQGVKSQNFKGHTWNGNIVSKEYYCQQAKISGMQSWGMELYDKKGCNNKNIVQTKDESLFNWYALAKHPKTNFEFIATRVSNKEDAKKIAIKKCYNFVSKELNKLGYNDCYIDLIIDKKNNYQLAEKITLKQENQKNRIVQKNSSDQNYKKKITNELQGVKSQSFKGHTWNGNIVSKNYYCQEALKAGMPNWGNELYREKGCYEISKTQVAKAEPNQTQKLEKDSLAFCVKASSRSSFGHVVTIFKQNTICEGKDFLVTKNSNEDFFNHLKKKYDANNGLFHIKPSYLAKILDNKKKKKVKVAKVEDSTQEEFKPKKTNQDNEAPIITIAEAITVNDASYEIEGKVSDSSKNIFITVDGRTIPVKEGKFRIKRFSPVDEQIEIIATDQWGNRSQPKLVNITIEQQETIVADTFENLDPSKIRTRSNKNRVALIIGIEKYDQTPEASYANLDAKYFYEYVRKGFGVSKANIKLLVDEDANLIQSLGTINKWLPSKIKDGKTELIIFFAGHGLASSDGKELYLLPQDSDPDLLARTALSRTELFQQIIALNPKSVTMFLDTCYSGISRDEKTLLASARPVRILANDQDTPNNFTIFSASQLDQISSGLKEAKHGIFSYYLMKGLEGNADINQDKQITNGELIAYMDQNVSQKASELGRQQNPSLAGDPDKILMSYR